MTFSMRRFQAIVGKEWKDAAKNPQVLLMVGMPIFFAFLFSKMGQNSMAGLASSILMALVMSGAFIQGMTVAEEKEKHTLRVLMLSPATATEILMGKSCLTAIYTLISIVLSIFVSGATLTNIPALALMIALLLIIFIALGTIIGLLSRTVSESSIVGLPVLLLFIMGPLFAPALKVDLLTTIVSYLPSDHFIKAMLELVSGGSFGDISANLINMGIWVVVSLVLAAIVYSRKRFDK
ncbi:ABC transporter permease [Paenibacillus albiflavus]|uniref:ABC transporter permease n=1 Tax=Paenibacillus albiflavus TaxID=2545760 RepID=A0A4R4DZ35_9BACL|nr:ABC transporter permease [Paenibacillus albiflavus]TCZ71069.1 ABC transporter permease [Paenibacillus albiflavus]